MREVLLFAHLAGLLALTAGVGASLACKLAAARAGSAAAVLALLTTANGAVRRCAMPGSFLLLASGIGLVAVSHGAWSMTEPWILGAIALWFASAVVGIRLHAPRSRLARELTADLAATDAPVSGRVRSLVRGGLPASLLDTALLAAMVALMVFKPGS
ncbi:MAG: putative integral rane protein [Thermoleophilia bacterium]|nr:putative integral rane protein [Thermoleophilia bacterium]